jgi:hypothetical protein
MKAQIFVSLAFAGSCFAIPALERRQGILKPPTTVVQKPFKYSETQGTLRSNSKHVTVVYGPYKVSKSQVSSHRGILSSMLTPISKSSSRGPAYGKGGKGRSGEFEGAMDPDGLQIGGPVKEGICNDCTILRARAEITDETGKALSIGSGLYLHHIVVAATQSKNVSRVFGTCSNPPPQTSEGQRERGLGQGRIVFAQGVENFTTTYTTKDGKFDSGYHTAGGSYVMTAEVVNYKAADIPVYITIDYDMVPGKVGQDANMAILSVTGLSPILQGNRVVADVSNQDVWNGVDEVDEVSDSTPLQTRRLSHLEVRFQFSRTALLSLLVVIYMMAELALRCSSTASWSVIH